MMELHLSISINELMETKMQLKSTKNNLKQEVDVLTCNHVTHDSINKHIMLQLQSLYATSPPTSFLWG